MKDIETSETKSTAMVNGIQVETTIFRRGNYETEYINDRRYDAYCHWCKTYRAGHIDYNTAMQIIRDDNLGQYFKAEDFAKDKPEIVIEKTVSQKRIESVIETYKRINPDKKLLSAGE